jgi:uncharacterized membrane protein
MSESTLLQSGSKLRSNRQSAASVDQLTQRNIEAVLELEKAAKEDCTPSDRIAKHVANFCGSMTFVWVHVLWFGFWILINSIPSIPHIDPFPFTFLTLVTSLEAIFLSTFILISQNQDTRISERRNHLDLQINLLSEQENTEMLRMLRAISEKVGADSRHDEQLHALTEETRPKRLAKQIEARVEE